MKTKINRTTIFGIIAVLMLAGATYGAYFYRSQSQLRNRQEMIHMQGMHVMPFDLNKTLHEFKKTDHGGTLSVVVRDASDTQDLALIRMHLNMEAEYFKQGDYSDPSGLHGQDMPGLSVLETSFSKISIGYTEIENGAQINFTTDDPATLSALHAWFDAQVSDHGADAVAQ